MNKFQPFFIACAGVFASTLFAAEIGQPQGTETEAASTDEAVTGEQEKSSASEDGPAEKSEEIVCKTIRVVNSRIPQRVCMMKYQWEAQREDALRNKESNRNRNSSCGVRC